MATSAEEGSLESIARKESQAIPADDPFVRFLRSSGDWIHEYQAQPRLQAVHIESSKKLSTANKKQVKFPPASNRVAMLVGRLQMEKKMEKTNQDKEHKMVRFEIDNCRDNIEFYKLQIENMEERLQELEKLRKAYEYY